MNPILTDLRYAWRSALRYPKVTLAIIVMIALGTGGVTAVFNPLYSMLFAPLPFPQPEQLVLIGGDLPMYNIFSQRFEPEEALDRIFSNLTSYRNLHANSVTMPDTGEIKQFYVVDVDEDFFGTLGVSPLRGSDFKHAEVNYFAAVVSNRFWRNELMGADDAIGKNIRASTMPGIYTIIGIMPESFDFPTGADIWLYKRQAPASHVERWFLGRLRPGITIGSAEEELRAVEFKPAIILIGRVGPLLQSLQTFLYGDRRPMLLMLGSTAVLFLILVCAGVMNLLVTLGTRRKPEMASRLIFGATRRNLVFQLSRETLPLVIVGALAGLWLSEVASSWLTAQFPALKGGEVAVPVKMAFFMALVLAATVIGGLTPALYASGVDLNTYLKSGGDVVKRRFFLFPRSIHELLVGIQLSLTLALLTGVGLLVVSMVFHVDVPIRWSSRDMAVARVEIPPEVRYEGRSTIIETTLEGMRRRTAFFQEFQHRLSTMPGVAAAGIFNPIPFSANAKRSTQIPRYASKNLEGEAVFIIEGRASREGFDMLGVTLFAGRHFSPDDMANEIAFNIRSREAVSTKGRAIVNDVGGVVIVNQALARRFWPGENALGKMIYAGGLNNAYEIVGIVRDFHYFTDNKDFIPAVYYPPDIYNLSQTFLVRLHSGSMKDFQQRLSGFDAGQATIEAESLGSIVSEATADMRMTLQLIGSFALLGIVVSGLGVYATMSLMAASWNREMGIRMAVGATAWDILRLALWRGIRAILFGLPVGLFLAWILSRVLARYLFLVKIDNLFVWITSCALLLIIVIVAAFIPALRVSRINPMNALRK